MGMVGAPIRARRRWRPKPADGKQAPCIGSFSACIFGVSPPAAAHGADLRRRTPLVEIDKGHAVPAARPREEMPKRPIECVVETGIYADDLDEAERFYRDVLGLTLLGKEFGRHVFFQVGDRLHVVGLPCRGDPSGRPGCPAHGARGPGHFAMGVAAEDLDAWRDQLQAHHVAIEHEEVWERGGQSLYFRDPRRKLRRADHFPDSGRLPAGW